MRKIAATIFAILFPFVINAQEINLIGKINNASNQAIQGVNVSLSNASLSTTTNSLGEFSFNRSGTSINPNLLTTIGSYFDGNKLYINCKNNTTFIDMYDMSGRKVASIINGDKISGSYFLYPTAYLNINNNSILLLRVSIDNNIQTYKAYYSPQKNDSRGLHNMSDNQIENFSAKNKKASILALDELVCTHNEYETKRIDITDYTSNLGTIRLSTKETSPDAPTSLTASASGSSTINISWNDNSSNETGFKIERSPNGSSSWAQITSTSANTTSYSNTGLTANTTYYYRVRAYNSTGNSGYSNTANAKTTTGITIPNAPTSLSASATGTTSINISWSDNSGDEDGFKIERSPNGSSSWEQITSTSANTTSYSNTGLTTNTTYYYRLRAYNSAGNSGYSNTANAKTQVNLIQPSAPSNLTVEAYSPTTCKLKWTDNSGNESGFKIQRESTVLIGAWVDVATVGANTTSYSHTSLSETWPAYRVCAYADLASNYTSSASAPAKLRIINNLANGGDWNTWNQLVRVRIGPTESSVTGGSSYERLQPAETVYDIGTVNTITPGYTNPSSISNYEDFDVEEDYGYSNYWIYAQCGWWDYIVVFQPYYWQKTMTIVYCTDGVSSCYKGGWINITNHYSGYFTLNATDILPHYSWSKKGTADLKYVSGTAVSAK